MRTLLTLILILTGCSTAYASGPDYVERTDESRFDAPVVLETPAVRGTPIQVTEPPVQLFIADPDWKCVEWFDLSLDAGFEPSDWPAMGIIMQRESNCWPWVHNTRDPAGGSLGLMQVNCSWRRYLADRGILQTCQDLFDPFTNLVAARAIVQYDRDRGQCDWKQWATKRGLC